MDKDEKASKYVQYIQHSFLTILSILIFYNPGYLMFQAKNITFQAFEGCFLFLFSPRILYIVHF